MKNAKENVNKYVRSLPVLGLIISIILIVLFFFIWKVEGNFVVIFIYCLLPVIVNTSVYGAYLVVRSK
ncbi:hypothetical protein RNS32_12250 [Staphylococcus pseudintermedius]|uniref:hypothetical protein n=1 Tax=Staphylococcus pseudintermedius TaxID=283734 RepID=UPI0001FFAEE6|nr:hypothetical protein [Staphylococcus pseudintermedius]ADX76345.1 conserved hypothetical protein [Staphylococcus pseudintermedius ED99]ANQ81533.1 hypothetical protein A9I66_05545 [Staphylococcus pseudintermedius]ANS89277.1 hypothetical protein A6M57_4795 [Staphylococcus pseudintermedius]ASQ50361.1 hypothetical protein SPS5912_05135 [Staphylococcus pseudintermedius]EGQ0287192.1 hypothetical protein [Staphylococcus pseudintermedius]